MLFDTFPVLATHNQIDTRLRYIVISGYICLSLSIGEARAYLSDLANGKFRRARTFALHLSVFLHHIARIVGGSTKKEMRWIDARAIVAMMANKKAVGNGTKVKLPTESMRQYLLLTVFIGATGAITAGMHASRPQPTIIGATPVNLLPKTSNKRAFKSIVSTNVAVGFALSDTSPSATFFGYRCLLSATTVAITVWDFLRGNILHVNSPFSTLTKPRDDSTHRRGNYFSASIIPQGAGL